MTMLTETRHSKRAPLQIVRFFKSGKKDMISITNAGDAGCEYIGKVTPLHVQEHPQEWDSYQLGQDAPSIVGTSLLEIPGFSPELERFYKIANIQVAEQLAEVSDEICQKLGLGSREFRKAAQLLIKSKAYDELTKLANPEPKESRDIGPEPQDLDSPKKRRVK